MFPVQGAGRGSIFSFCRQKLSSLTRTKFFVTPSLVPRP